MLTFSKKLLASLLVAVTVHCAWSQSDSTYIYLCATTDGHSGLIMGIADTPDAREWSDRGVDLRLTGSDFGGWGSGKKMFSPSVSLGSDGVFHLLFCPDKEGTVLSYSSSPDLINWTVQEYRYPADARALVPASAVTGISLAAKLGDRDVTGSVFKVPTQFVENIKQYKRYRDALSARNSERTAQDTWRFAGRDTVNLTLKLKPTEAKPISDRLIGIFFEDINYAADGGLYAELVQNRDFEYSPSDRGNDLHWHSTKAWSLSDSSAMSTEVKTAVSLHANNPHYLVITPKGKNGYLLNSGYDGINVKRGDKYNISIWVNTPARRSVTVALLNSQNKTIGKTRLNLQETDQWVRLVGSLSASEDCADARLGITFTGKSDLAVDLVSLMPADTYNNRENGLRKDLAEALAALKPRFVRFPGGCVAHGDGIDNIYDWKGSIGSLQERKCLRNLWGYHQTRGLGYHEYFLMCEDFGAEPLPVLAAGVPCQNSTTHSHVSHDLLTNQGQQCGIPMSEMPAYIQDILDLIEYANGDITTTWGAKRAEAGHPSPFNLKMIGIGNEDIISETFKERFLMIFNAIKEHYPEIEVVGTVGPFYEGADYTAGWEFAREHDIPMVDEHYYVEPGWLIHNGDYYDNYPRGGTQVYLGEYASHLPDRASSLEAALSNALYLTSVERNADVVTMTSYAPLLAKENHTQWRPDLIYFNNDSVMLTPDYYVQKMYGNNSGTHYIPADRQLSDSDPDLAVRLGNSITIDNATGDIIVKLVNMTPLVIKTSMEVNGKATRTLLTGNPDDTDCHEMIDEVEINDDGYQQPPYSFTVLRFRKDL